MNRIQFDGRTDAAGSLQVRVPGPPGRRAVRITIEWDDGQASEAVSWPAGWFEATAESIHDDTFVRPPQGTYESRDTLP